LLLDRGCRSTKIVRVPWPTYSALLEVGSSGRPSTGYIWQQDEVFTAPDRARVGKRALFWIEIKTFAGKRSKKISVAWLAAVMRRSNSLSGS
jgi:hypothetical protein